MKPALKARWQPDAVSLPVIPLRPQLKWLNIYRAGCLK